MEETKKDDSKRAKTMSINIEFKDVDNGIFRGLIEIRTFDHKDTLKERGYTFEGKASGEVRNNKAVKIFTQKQEIYGTDAQSVRAKMSREVDEITKLFFVKMLDVQATKEETNSATKKNT